MSSFHFGFKIALVSVGLSSLGCSFDLEEFAKLQVQNTIESCVCTNVVEGEDLYAVTVDCNWIEPREEGLETLGQVCALCTKIGWSEEAEEQASMCDDIEYTEEDIPEGYSLDDLPSEDSQAYG